MVLLTFMTADLIEILRQKRFVLSVLLSVSLILKPVKLYQPMDVEKSAVLIMFLNQI